MSRQLKAAIAFGNFVVGTAHGIFPAARKHVGCLAASSSQRLVSDLFSSACCNLQSNSLTNTVPSCRSCNTNSSCNSSNSFFLPVLAATVRCSGRLGQVIKLRASRRESPYVRVPTSQPARDLPRVGSSLGSAPVWKKMSLEHFDMCLPCLLVWVGQACLATVWHDWLPLISERSQSNFSWHVQWIRSNQKLWMNVGTLLSSLEILKRTYTYPDAAKEELRRQRSHHASRKSYESYES